jgi:hypothetical protein
MSEQTRRVRNQAIPEWAEALYFEVKGKNSGVMRFTFDMIKCQKVVEEYRESPE